MSETQKKRFEDCVQVSIKPEPTLRRTAWPNLCEGDFIRVTSNWDKFSIDLKGIFSHIEENDRQFIIFFKLVTEPKKYDFSKGLVFYKEYQNEYTNYIDLSLRF